MCAEGVIGSTSLGSHLRPNYRDRIRTDQRLAICESVGNATIIRGPTLVMSQCFFATFNFVKFTVLDPNGCFVAKKKKLFNRSYWGKFKSQPNSLLTPCGRILPLQALLSQDIGYNKPILSQNWKIFSHHTIINYFRPFLSSTNTMLFHFYSHQRYQQCKLRSWKNYTTKRVVNNFRRSADGPDLKIYQP